MIPFGITGTPIMKQRSEPAVLSGSIALASSYREEEKRIVNAFNDRIAELSKTYSERETAIICRVSINYVCDLRDKRGLTFADRKLRTKQEAAAISKQFKVDRAATYVREVNPKKSIKAGALKVPQKLERAGAIALKKRENEFLIRVTRLSESMSFHESAALLNVSPRFLRNYCYQYEIEFPGYHTRGTEDLELFSLEEEEYQQPQPRQVLRAEPAGSPILVNELLLDDDEFDDGEVPCWAKYLPGEPHRASARA